MKLGVPSKGRLKKEVLSWFNHKGVEIITSELINLTLSLSAIGSFRDLRNHKRGTSINP